MEHQKVKHNDVLFRLFKKMDIIDPIYFRQNKALLVSYLKNKRYNK